MDDEQLIEQLATLPQERILKAVLNAAAKKFGIEVSEGDAVAKAAGEPHSAGIFVQIEKADLAEGVIYGVASVANIVDREGDVIRPDVLRKAAHDFLANRNGAFDDTHDYAGGGDIGGKLVESWMDGDTWRIGFKPDDIEIAKAAAAGEYVGFSVEGTAQRTEVL